MFDLEQAIANWRNEMSRADIRCPEVLDELESHLRDDVAEQIHAGADARTAFEAAVQRLGGPRLIKAEFAKTDRNTSSTWISLTGWIFLAGLIVWLNVGLRDQLQTVCLMDVVMLSLVLPLMAARRCRGNLAMRKRFTRIVWVGQFGGALGGILIVLSPQHAVWGLAFAMIVVAICASWLVRQARNLSSAVA